MDSKSVLIGAIAGCCIAGYFINKDKKETVIHKTTVIEKDPTPSFKAQNRDYFEEVETYIPPVQKIQVKRQRVAPVPIIIQQPSVQYIPETRYVEVPCYPCGRRYSHPPVPYFRPPVRPFYHHDFPRGPRHFAPRPPVHHHDFRHNFRNFHHRQRHW